MAHITIEYVILMPLLILQIFLLPFATTIIMGYWTKSSNNLALQDAASQLGSSIQQLYFSINHASIPSGNVTSKLNIPVYINNYAYTGNATLLSPSGSNAAKVLSVTLNFKGLAGSVTTPVALGQNVQWQSSTFVSNSTTACLNAYKYSNGTILLYFGA